MSDQRPILTTRQGHPVRDNQSTRTVGERGPATLENYQFIEKITHFDRERIPERVVHARGAGAHGWFEAYGKIGDEPASKYTRARVLNETGVKTSSSRPSTATGTSWATTSRSSSSATRSSSPT
jgi:catalase